MPFYEESANGEEYRDETGWHVKKSVIERESKSLEYHNSPFGYRYIENNAKRFHKGTDSVRPYGYKRDILVGSGKYFSTGHLKDL